MSLWSRLQLWLSVKAEAVLARTADPQATLEFAYQQHRGTWQTVRAELVEVTTARKQLELHLQRQRLQVTVLEGQARQAVASQRPDLARLALQRKQVALAEMAQLETQLAEVAQDEHQLGLAEQHCAQQAEASRTHRTLLTARHTAAQAQIKARAALSGLSQPSADLGQAVEQVEARIEHLRARAAALDGVLNPNGWTVLTTGQDGLTRELQALVAQQAVESELAELQMATEAPLHPNTKLIVS